MAGREREKDMAENQSEANASAIGEVEAHVILGV